MNKATTTTESATTSAATELATLRLRSDEVDAELDQLQMQKGALQKKLSQGAGAPSISEMVRRVIAGKEPMKAEDAVAELARLEEREASLSRASDVLFAAIVPLERQEYVERLLPAFRAAEAFIPKLAAALDQVEAVQKAAAAAVDDFEQASSGMDFWTAAHVHGIQLPFNPDELQLLRAWQADFIPDGTTAATSPRQLREALYMLPTRVERWRELAAELGVKLAKSAVWPDRSRGYLPLAKPRIGGTAWIRLRTILADAIGTGKPGDILQVSGEEAADLIAGGFGEPATEKDADARLRTFGLAHKGKGAGDEDRNSEAEALADPKGDAPVKKHLAGVAAASRTNHRGDADEDWTPK